MDPDVGEQAAYSLFRAMSDIFYNILLQDQKQRYNCCYDDYSTNDTKEEKKPSTVKNIGLFIQNSETYIFMHVASLIFIHLAGQLNLSSSVMSVSQTPALQVTICRGWSPHT